MKALYNKVALGIGTEETVIQAQMSAVGTVGDEHCIIFSRDPEDLIRIRLNSLICG